jgi:hypothetical protein
MLHQWSSQQQLRLHEDQLQQVTTVHIAGRRQGAQLFWATCC